MKFITLRASVASVARFFDLHIFHDEPCHLFARVDAQKDRDAVGIAPVTAGIARSLALNIY